jgi:hypothetical protein
LNEHVSRNDLDDVRMSVAANEVHVIAGLQADGLQEFGRYRYLPNCRQPMRSVRGVHGMILIELIRSRHEAEFRQQPVVMKPPKYYPR